MGGGGERGDREPLGRVALGTLLTCFNPHVKRKAGLSNWFTLSICLSTDVGL